MLTSLKRVAQGSNFVFEGSNRTILDLRGLSTDFKSKKRVLKIFIFSVCLCVKDRKMHR